VKDLLDYIAKGLVDHPDEVEISERSGGVWELRVAEIDRGKVIGRKGRTAHAIRTLMVAAADGGETPSLEIVD
jgi:hypothetical protein